MVHSTISSNTSCSTNGNRLGPKSHPRWVRVTLLGCPASHLLFHPTTGTRTRASLFFHLPASFPRLFCQWGRSPIPAMGKKSSDKKRDAAVSMEISTDTNLRQGTPSLFEVWSLDSDPSSREWRSLEFVWMLSMEVISYSLWFSLYFTMSLMGSGRKNTLILVCCDGLENRPLSIWGQKTKKKKIFLHCFWFFYMDSISCIRKYYTCS